MGRNINPLEDTDYFGCSFGVCENKTRVFGVLEVVIDPNLVPTSFIDFFAALPNDINVLDGITVYGPLWIVERIIHSSCFQVSCLEKHGYWTTADVKNRGTVYSPTCKMTYGELYRKTMSRLNELKLFGYNIVTMWENDFKKMVKNKIN